MIRKKSAMAIARKSGRRNLELFAATGVLRIEAKGEVESWESEALQAFQAGVMSAAEYNPVRLLRDYVETNVK